MSKGETASEPSMDEILSSIRKIIAEDEVEESPADAPEEPEASAPALDEAEIEADDDILELTEHDEVAVEPESEADMVDDVPDPTEPEPATPEVEDDPFKLDGNPLEADQEATAPPPEPELGAAPEERPEATADAAVMTSEMTEVLLDSGTATAASGALQRLSAAMSPGAALPEGDRTIEAFLADLVRPELKAWLDQHLPGLVERIVEREIKKLVRDAQPE